MNGIAGQVALVTGAARPLGIGRATALRLAMEGARVACLDLGEPPAHAPDHGVGTMSELDDTVSMIRDAGGEAIALRADVSDSHQVADAHDRIRDELGPVSLCCALAGGTGFGNGIAPLTELSEAEWNWAVDVNLKGTWITASASARQMIEAGRGGRVVTASSAVGLRGGRSFGAYAAAKAGVISLTQTFAVELGHHGITVNTVVPGMIDTQASQPIRDRLDERNLLDDLRRDIPLGRFGTADDVAGAIAHLCSDDAAYITGDVVNLTGGHVLS